MTKRLPYLSIQVPGAGLAKLMKAVEKPKEPTEALRRLMRSEDSPATEDQKR